MKTRVICHIFGQHYLLSFDCLFSDFLVVISPKLIYVLSDLYVYRLKFIIEAYNFLYLFFFFSIQKRFSSTLVFEYAWSTSDIKPTTINRITEIWLFQTLFIGHVYFIWSLDLPIKPFRNSEERERENNGSRTLHLGWHIHVDPFLLKYLILNISVLLFGS